MRASINWVTSKLAFIVGLAVFVLAMFDVLPGIFLFVGFTIYAIAVPFSLYPKERLLPSDSDMATVSILMQAATGQAPLRKPREENKAAPIPWPARITSSHWLSSFHLPRHKA